jgi:hypothetical protein
MIRDKGVLPVAEDADKVCEGMVSCNGDSGSGNSFCDSSSSGSSMNNVVAPEGLVMTGVPGFDVNDSSTEGSSFSGFVSTLRSANSLSESVSADSQFPCNLSCVSVTSNSTSIWSGSCRLCRGCHFEAILEARSSHERDCESHRAVMIEPDAPAVEVTSFSNELSNDFEHYKFTLDWDESDAESFVLSSVDSCHMIDVSQESIDKELLQIDKAETNEMSIMGYVAPEMAISMPSVGDADHLGNPNEDAHSGQGVLTGTCEEASRADISESTFEGFSPKPALTQRLQKVKKQAKQLYHSAGVLDGGVHTRSRGAVQDLPLVQPLIIERASARRRWKSS